MWKAYALLSALFAAVTAICIKLGVKDIDAYLALALRVSVVLVIVWGVVLATGTAGQVRDLDRGGVLFLLASAVATGLSWLFYFKAMQAGDVATVAALDKMSVPLVMVFAFLWLGEPVTARVVVGGVLITGGSLLMIK